ncbi:hypothetical protein FACS189420_8040 [Bacteroidia bacterium]|nr:hypothetical protein FACS18947_0360 [Bacteroidia bacterium]GHV71810.1 hypothetical protein FACS189420_8040 [Bacteroidia bacterium]
MKRRDFLKTTAAVGVAALTFDKLQAAINTNSMVVEAVPDMVAVMGGEPAQLLERALTEMGGIEKYVKKGQNVVIKPNIGWDKKPNFAANTNPELVEALVKQCFKAGAKKVSVFDHTCDNWQKCYESSGIKKAAEGAGAVVLPANDEAYYKEVSFPKGVKLKSAKIHQALLEADVWFNVPVLKNHGGAKMSIAMKNYMGIVWDRPYFHSNDLQQCIADACTYTKKPALNIIDAYRCLQSNGPQGRSVSDTSVLKTLIISTDIVAADTAAIGLFNQVKEMDIKEVGHIANGEKLNLGTQKIDKLNVKRIKL